MPSSPSSPAGADDQLHVLLVAGLDRDASDLHLVAGYPPTLRVHGQLEPIGDNILTPADTSRMITSMMPAELREQLGRRHDFDLSITVDHDGAIRRCRANVFYHQGAMGAALRFVPEEIPSFDWMGFPEALATRIADLHGGLVLVTGVTGSGKTTTLAALVELMNRSGDRRIITVEEPIEYVYAPQARSVVTQREVGIDVPSFADGLKYGLRQDPDVILVGEIRDMETARMVITSAETGHLVLSTVHTRDARGAVTRLVDIFPEARQGDIRGQLALSLQFVISQHLLPHIEPGRKRVLAMEVLVANDPVRAAIRQNKIENIDTAIQTGKKYGMQPLDEDLMRLVHAQQISPATARRVAKNPELFRA